MSTPSASPSSNTQTVARNSFWYGLEMASSLFAAFICSILVARAVGPGRLGHFNYLVWMTNITAAVGGFGLPSTVRKYMAEYLNCGQAGIARSIYGFAMRLQVLISAGVTCAGLGLLFWLGDPGYRLISVLLVLNLAPRMIGYIPSQANNAVEVMKRNTRPAILGGALTVGITLFSLWIGWDLLGVAASMTIGSTVETVLKLWSVRGWLNCHAPEPIPPALKRRMFTYSGQGITLMVLNVVVWDRSDMVALRALNSDIRQVAFFSLAFNLTERILMFPNAFANSLGVTMMAQYGRGQERVNQLTLLGARYACLLALPLLTGLACVSRPAVLLLYGKAYLPLVPVLTVAALLAIPKALVAPATALLQTTERQSFLIWTYILCGALDVGLDIALTPSQGALGAALANGIAQLAAAFAIWYRCRRIFHMDLGLGAFARMGVAAAAMAGSVVLIGYAMPGRAGLAVSVMAGAAVWFAVLRFSRALDSSDRERLLHIGRVLPSAARPLFHRVLSVLIAGAPAARAVSGQPG